MIQKTKIFSLLILLTLIVIFLCSKTDAKPYMPKNDSVILEKVSLKDDLPTTNELRKLHEEVLSNLEDKEIAINFVRKCIELSRIHSDPRYLGYGEAVLKPWLKKKEPSADILVLNSIIKQSYHDFESSLEHLSKALKIDPRNVQGWLTKAQVHITRGEYSKAKQSCTYLIRTANELVSIACVAHAGGLSGSADKSYNLLNKVFNDIVELDSISKNEKAWALSILADIASRSGKNNAARAHFKKALELNPKDNYTLAAYSDFLLSQKKFKSVTRILHDKENIDSLLLRLTIAEKRLKLKEAKEHTKELKSRFAASRLRKSTLHLREESIFTLKILNNPKKALKLAKKNWKKQKEPIDAHIFLEAAIAAKDKLAAKPVIDFMNKSNIEDRALTELVKKLMRLES